MVWCISLRLTEGKFECKRWTAKGSEEAGNTGRSSSMDAVNIYQI